MIFDLSRKYPYILPQQRSVNNWQRWYGVGSYDNNSISCFVQMPHSIKESKDDKNQVQRRLNNHIIKINKLFDFFWLFWFLSDASIRPNVCLSVSRLVCLCVEIFENQNIQKNQILFDCLILWMNKQHYKGQKWLINQRIKGSKFFDYFWLFDCWSK